MFDGLFGNRIHDALIDEIELGTRVAEWLIQEGLGATALDDLIYERNNTGDSNA